MKLRVGIIIVILLNSVRYGVAQDDPVVLEIQELNRSLGLEVVPDRRLYDTLLNQLVVKYSDDEFKKLIKGHWKYEYTVKSNGEKYRSKSVAKKFYFDDRSFYKLIREDTVKGTWLLFDGHLACSYDEPYFYNGKPDDIESLSEDEILSITRDSIVYFIYKLTSSQLIIVSTSRVTGLENYGTVQFKVYEKGVKR